MLFRNIFTCAVIACAFQATSTSAQSLSAADILAQVDQRVSGLNEYQQLLNDPDPARSMAAMEIMLKAEDVAVVRLALDYGLYSPNLAVKRAALEAFIETQPVLNIYIEQAEGEKNSTWDVYASRGDGSVLDDDRIHYSYKVGKFDDEQSCYVYSVSNSRCMLRISDEQVSYSVFEKWHSLKLNEQGQLVGSGSFPNSEKPVKTTIQIGQ